MGNSTNHFLFDENGQPTAEVVFTNTPEEHERVMSLIDEHGFEILEKDEGQFPQKIVYSLQKTPAP